MNGTNVGAAMQARATLSSWRTLSWDTTNETASGVTAGEGQLLYGLARALRPDTLIEVGTSYGHGTLHLAAAVRDNGTGHVYTVEIDAGRREAAAVNIADAGLSHHVTQADAIPSIPADFVFLDAGHTADDLRQYLRAIDLKPGAVVVIHDAAFMGHATEIAREGGFNIVHLPTDSMCGTAILRRGE